MRFQHFKQYFAQFNPQKIALVSLACLGLMTNPAKATTPVSFVYVHGVNNHGENSQEIIYNKFDKLHQNLLRRFEEEPLTPAMLDIASMAEIDRDPAIFYWYAMSQDAVKSLDTDLGSVWDIVKKAPGLSGLIQNNIASMLQDTFWLINESNQVQINDSLNRFIAKEIPPQNKIILFGYSGGAIIDFNYLINYLPYIDLYGSAEEEEQNKNPLPAELKEKFKDPGLRHTCVKALLDKQIARYDSQGNLVMFLDNLNLGNSKEMDSLRNKYILQSLPGLKAANAQLCLPTNRLKGVVTFGSPVAALSSRSMKSTQGALYLAMARYMIDNNIFWLNLNRINDPLGYSIPVDILEGELQNRFKTSLYGPDKGFIFSNVLYQNRVFFYKAHFWYLKDPMIFSNAVVTNLRTGYQKHLDNPNKTKPGGSQKTD